VPLQDLGEVRIYYERSGTGPQHIVFVHGLRNSGDVWRTTRERLNQQRFTSWFLDLPGCGHSPAPKRWEHCTIERYAEDTFGFCRDLGITDAVLVGHSLGCGIAALLALDHPELIRGLVLAAPVSFQGLDYVPADWQEALIHPTDEKTRYLARLAFHRMPDDEMFARLLDMLSSASPVHVEGAVRSMRDFRIIDRLGELHTPTLVVEGDRNHHVPLPNTLNIAAAVPGCLLQVFHNVGHVPFIEVPDEFVALLEEFVGVDLPAAEVERT
jgi:pyruvate dehydrogenase E2 component (dihydrolipoamide acetyltransferase)